VAYVIERIAAFKKSEYRDEDGAFIERQARLLFLSFLKPIINGTGHYAVEPETRGSRRMDVVVFYGNEEHIIELKIWYGPQAAAEGYDQLVMEKFFRREKFRVYFMVTIVLYFCYRKMPRLQNVPLSGIMTRSRFVFFVRAKGRTSKGEQKR
jgi:hypothetical protein